MKHFLIAIALACVLSVSAFAGEVPTSGFVPPPPGTTQPSTTTSPGEVPTSGLVQELSDDAWLAVLLTIIGMGS